MNSSDGSDVDKQVMKRTIFLSKTASMTWLELQGVNGRKWCLSELVMRNILLPDYLNKRDTNTSIANNMIRRVNLQSMYVDVGTRNTFPFAIGVRIQGFSPMEFSSSGDGFNFIIPQQTSISEPVLVFESFGDEKLQETWENEFAKWNIDNLDTLMAMIVPDSDVVLVHMDHPILQILEKRQDLFGNAASVFTASSTPNWRHVQKSAFDNGSAWIKSNILNKSSRTFDFSQLNVSFAKIDGSKFTELSPSCFVDMNFEEIEDVESLNSMKENWANIVMQRPFLLDLKLSMRYKLGSVDAINTR